MDRSSTSDVSSALQTHESDRSIFLAAKGGSIVFAGSLFGYGSQLVLGIFLTRFMGAEQYGQYKVAVIAGEMAAGFALLGLDYAMVRFVAFFASRRDVPGLWGTLQIGVGVTALSSLLIGGGLFVLATPLALHLFHEPRLVPLLRLASLIVPFSAVSITLAAATMGFNKMQYNAAANQIAQPLTRLILLVPMALLGLTAGRALIPYIGGLIVTCALLFYFLNHLFPLTCPLRTGRHDTRELIRFSLPAYFSTLINTFGPSLQTILLSHCRNRPYPRLRHLGGSSGPSRSPVARVCTPIAGDRRCPVPTTLGAPQRIGGGALGSLDVCRACHGNGRESHLPSEVAEHRRGCYQRCLVSQRPLQIGAALEPGCCCSSHRENPRRALPGAVEHCHYVWTPSGLFLAMAGTC